MKKDAWQEKLLATKGNIALCSPRQMGKSTIISEDAGEYAMRNPKKSIMIIASVERQALLLFEKVLSHIYLTNKGAIKTGKHRPTKHELRLKNGSIIRCLPTGDSGYGIRGYTIDRLYADEAAFIKEEVWAAVTPMLATTGGDIVLLSTPFGVDNYFYRSFNSRLFTAIYVNPEEVIKGREEPQRTNLINFRRDEKERMTKLQYQQEHMGLFVGGIQRFVTDAQIDQICVIPKKDWKLMKGDNYQGIDIARFGGDETVMLSLHRSDTKFLTQTDFEIPEPQTITDTARSIIHKDYEINHKKIYMDDGGLGVGVYDILFETDQTRRKVKGMNNAQRVIDKIPKPRRIGSKRVIFTPDRRKPLLGEDMAVNLKNLIEQGRIKLFDDPRIRHSLRSMQVSYEDGKYKVFGNYDHIFEALKRAAYSTKDKSLNIYVF